MELVTKYIFTWVGFDGNVEIHFNVDGTLKLVKFDGSAWNDKQRLFMLSSLAVNLTEDKMPNMAKEAKSKVLKVDYELTFDMFYEEFDNKQGRKVPLKVWNGMTPEDQLKAYLGIKPYKDRVKKQGVAQCYPETYLRQTRWDI